MAKIFAICLLLTCFSIRVKGDHIAGGDIYYTCIRNQDGTFTYNVTFKLYKRCASSTEIKNPTTVSVFEKGSYKRITDISVKISSIENLQLTNIDPCISYPPDVCFQVIYYKFSVALPESDSGYIIATEANNRINGFANVLGGPGATYTAEIPASPNAQNNSAVFSGNDLVIVCANYKFSYDFGAQDADGDQLRYSFCTAYDSKSGGNEDVPVKQPPFAPVFYGNGFNADSPMGITATLNQETGVLSGIAPAAGFYLVAVCVQEIRKGVVIATQRKDIQIRVAPCIIASASLLPEYLLCKNSHAIHLTNLTPSPVINKWQWELSNSSGAVVYTSSKESIDYNFPDTGMYKIKLVINQGEKCEDSAFSIARVYPGLNANFDYAGSCFMKPFMFTDKSASVSGNVTAWHWLFGPGDTSDFQNPEYTYSSAGFNNVQLIATNNWGCKDTVVKVVTVIDAQPISLGFRDTLICKGDSLNLNANGQGSFSWSPDTDIDNSTIPTPVVAPDSTTIYKVHIDNDGCTNNDSVLVRVADHIDLNIMNDTAICSGDTIQLRTRSNAITFKWSPSAQVIDPYSQDPLVVTNTSTIYTIKAQLGACLDSATVLVKAMPDPSANAGNDTTICYNTSAQLHASISGSTFTWSPSTGLDDASKINPVASPVQTTSYVLSVTDSLGCPKVSNDTVTVKVLPLVEAFAGKDTSVTVGQPVQLNASGGTTYLWEPATGLSSTDVANPIAIYNQAFDSIRYEVVVSNEAHCRDSAFVTVKVFNSPKPVIFVPSAFTPNGDGLNDFFHPVVEGMKQIIMFHVYNRWGKLVFSAGNTNTKWDGTFQGRPQPQDVYVWTLKAIDYQGTISFQKGIVTLVR
ncbi:MAG: gliding motility-associated C-terminal domain-containing protein [Ginsengibacter sp.]